MSLNVFTDPEFAADENNNAPPVDLDTETAQLVAAARSWVSEVQTFAQTAPKEGLTRLLRVSTVLGGDRTVPVLNAARALIGRAFPPAHNRAAYNASEALYHLCLHRVLLRGLGEIVERQGLATPVQLDPLDRDGVVTEILDEKEVLSGLVQACVEVVALGLDVESDADLFPAASMRMERNKQWAELMQALVWIRNATRGEPLAGAYPGEGDAVPLPELPKELDNEMQLIQERCIELYCFQRPSTYFERSAAFVTPPGNRARVPSASWRASNGRIVLYITEKAEEFVENRAIALCAGLCRVGGGAAGEAIAEPFREATCALVATVMNHHFDLVFGRNPTLISIAAVLTAAKWCGLRLKITAMLNVAKVLFNFDDKDITFSLEMPHSAKVKAASIGIDPGSDEEVDPGEGPPKEFYNRVFVPIMSMYRTDGSDDMAELFGDKGPALKAAVAAAQRDLNGGQVIVLEYPPGTVPRSEKRIRRIVVEETPEPGLHSGSENGGVLAGSAGASTQTSGPLTSPELPGGHEEPGVASARRPSATRPGAGKRTLLGVSAAAGALASKKKR